MASSPFDNAVPRTRDGINQLLSERPPAWQYLLYSAVLVQGIADLETRYWDHEAGFICGDRIYVADEEVFDELNRQMEFLSSIVVGLDIVFDLDAERRAFGSPGTEDADAVPPDADRTIHLASQLIRLYGELLDWAAGLRRMTIADDNLRRAAAIQAHFVDQPLIAIREFVDDMIQHSSSFVSRLFAGEQIVLTQTVTLELPEGLVRDRTDALRAWVENTD